MPLIEPIGNSVQFSNNEPVIDGAYFAFDGFTPHTLMRTGFTIPNTFSFCTFINVQNQVSGFLTRLVK